MRTASECLKHFEKLRLRQPFRAQVHIDDNGLSLGRGTMLAHFEPVNSRATLSTDEGERALALLSVVYGRAISAARMRFFARAAARWRDAEPALAYIELAFAQLPPIASDQDAYRLFLADELLEGTLNPRQLTQALDLQIKKYDPEQPRVAGGSGRNSGRWLSDTTSALVAPTASAAGRTLLGAATPSIVAALSIFAARFAVPTTVLGALLIPALNSSGVSEGAFADTSDIHFRRDGPAGTLRLTARSADGSGNVTVSAQSRRGVFTDVATGKPLGRDLGEQLYLDLDAVRDAFVSAWQRASDDPKAGAESEQEDAKLCPAPGRDTPHGSSNAAKDYEDDVHQRVNPLAPIPREFAVMFTNPLTGLKYHFDDCYRYSGDLVDGDMKVGDLVDAKGKRYGPLILNGKTNVRILADLFETAQKQLKVTEGTGRRIKWYFAEQTAADAVSEEFIEQGLDITVVFMPPRKRR